MKREAILTPDPQEGKQNLRIGDRNEPAKRTNKISNYDGTTPHLHSRTTGIAFGALKEQASDQLLDIFVFEFEFIADDSTSSKLHSFCTFALPSDTRLRAM